MTNPTITLTVDRQCCLTGAPSSVLDSIRSYLTIDNPKYMDAKRYSRWVGKTLKPTLHFYSEQKDALCFPRGFGNGAVRMCRKHAGCTPQIIDNRRSLDPLAVSFSGDLRPYQALAVEDVCRHSFGVLEAGTGSGKTIMALNIISRRSQPTLILVHSKELLFQWKERIRCFLGTEAGQAGGGKFELQPITVAIVNTARKHLDTLPGHFGQLIVDECHRVPASLFTDVVSAFDCTYMLGLSATAFRREDGMTRLIYLYMGDRVHQVSNEVLAASGAVVIPELICKETTFHYRYRGEYSKLMKALAEDKERNTQIADDVDGLVKNDPDGIVLVVSDRVQQCEEISSMLHERQCITAVLTGQISQEQRSTIVDQVQQGEIQVLLATIQLIGEGFDCPGLTSLVLATPIKFQGRLLQVVGRVMRPSPGKKARVIDYVDTGIPLLVRSAEARKMLFSSL
ncbi:DEAD/DEAH box helicase [Desulfogranum japonicum]|uniref:DEAD/DEAH box helicase n=1 Tax=Desulfogranum japonicum TaxID=231447 RepID=UPI0003FE9DC6|nr:DEAD/DEAH box helicase [Desulfogranum japonicum]